ncbi:MAG TPA: OB-fold nucleic acid binding domain-containing protein, partial [Tepidisphaeraceae bacterium]|nr:OB-fold nucleic acid binding domain-containing protein [Tepidisphaeraceae bacterium]
GSEVTIGGMLTRIKKTVTKNGRSAGMQMAMVTLEDLEGKIDGVCFAETFAEINEKYPGAIANEQIVFMKGKVDKRRETPSIVVSEIIPVADSVNRLTTGMVVQLDQTRHTPETIEELTAVLKQHAGRTPTFASVKMADGRTVIIKLGSDFGIKPSPNVAGDVERVLGSGSVQLVGLGTKRAKRAAQQSLFNHEAEEAESESVGTGAGEGEGDEQLVGEEASV